MEFTNYELESLDFNATVNTDRPITTAHSEAMEQYELLRNIYEEETPIIERVPISCIEDCLEHME